MAEFRYISKQGGSNLALYGLHRGFFEDLYHSWLASSWRRVFAVVIVLYLAVNAVFAAAYMAAGGIENARPHSYADYYFFSVQTLATIGYGKMSPVTLPAHLLVTIESFCGLTGLALVTGLMFAKFARPTARVLWSEVAVVSPMDGVQSLMFRVANARGNQVVEAQMRLGMLRSETTAEGTPVRRQVDLKLVRPSTAVFALSWLCVHRIEPGSPLYGESPESLAKVQAELYCSLVGLDADFSQTIHSRHSYAAVEIRWGFRFDDIMGELPDGRMGVDYTRFHRTLPAPLDGPKAG
ncbi:MAG TPA: ion channel [Myxococcales bacterium]|nr:ion channel [Myxococcales bacterium]